MKPLSRRRALLLGGLGIAATAAGGGGLAWTLASRTTAVPGGELVQPAETRSANGQLQVRLQAAPGPMVLGGRQATAVGYNGASHGCVNVRDYDGVAALFDQVQLGDKVIVYWS